MNKVIVTGGSGYIGQGLVYSLLNSGYDVMSIDLEPCELMYNLNIPRKRYNTSIQNLATDEGYKNVVDDIREWAKGCGIKALFHLASWKDIEGSIYNPIEYIDNNLKSTINTGKLCEVFPIENYVFSSSAAVYNSSARGSISENDAKPDNPYGLTKLLCENIISTFTARKFIFRYQNPMGLIKGITVDTSDSMFGNILNSLKNKTTFKIYGGDYDTPDGTCIRDYVDINDVIKLHQVVLDIESMDWASRVSFFEILNIGRGYPVSCKDVCDAVKTLCPEFNYIISDRREGDSAGSYADIQRLQNFLEVNNVDFAFKPLEETIKELIDVSKG